MLEECVCEVGMATQQHRQCVQRSQVLFQRDRNSCWNFLSSSEKSASAILRKKRRGKPSEVNSLANTEKNLCTHILFVHVYEWARACKHVGGCLFFPPHCVSGAKGHCPRSPPRTWPGDDGLAFLSWEVRLSAWAEPDESSSTRLLLCLRPLLLKEPTLLFFFRTYFWFEKTWLKGKPSTFQLPLELSKERIGIFRLQLHFFKI